jgi:transposase
MNVLVVDMHMGSHTVAAIAAATGELLGDKTIQVGEAGFIAVLDWARSLGEQRVRALEDCRHVSGSFERFLIISGERVVRVATRLMADARRAARDRGKSDRIDALAVARAALREGVDALPSAQLAGIELDIRLLVDHRERLIRSRVVINNDLLWHLHDLWPDLKLEVAPQLLSEPGFGPLTAAKLLGEIAGAHRFTTEAKLARAAGVAPIPVSSRKTNRHRLDRGGNRQLNAAIHRIALTRARCHSETQNYLARKRTEGKTNLEAMRCLKRHLTRRVWHLLQPPHPSRGTAPSPSIS